MVGSVDIKLERREEVGGDEEAEGGSGGRRRGRGKDEGRERRIEKEGGRKEVATQILTEQVFSVT